MAIRTSENGITNRCSRQCTRCLSCGLAVAQLYHKPNTAYTAAERGVMRKDMKPIFMLAILLCGCSDLKIDKCLDDGGSFNYEKCVCDFESNHQSKSTHNC